MTATIIEMPTVNHKDTPKPFGSDPNPGPIVIKGVPYTRGQIAKDTGLSMSHISRIFNGHRVPSLRTASKLCAYFCVTMDELCTAMGWRKAA